MATTVEQIDGVAVQRIGDPSSERPPLLFVHGGLHGSWCFEPLMRWLAERGWFCHALNWLGRHGSVDLADDVFVRRSILDVRTEIGTVVREFDSSPVLIGHSMGGLASLAYACKHVLAGLILLAPVVPGRFADEPIDLPVDPERPWGPPPPEVARNLFWAAASTSDAARYYERLVPESPTAVMEATRWSVEIPVERVTTPTRLMAAADDPLVPARYVERLAASMSAPCVTLPDRGHGLTLEPGWEQVAAQIDSWTTEMTTRAERPRHA